MRFRGARLATVAMIVCAGIAGAQVSSTADPIFHGVLRVEPSSGTIDQDTGNAVIRARRWSIILSDQESNGIYPDQEPVILALGENSYFLPAGMLKPSRNGKRFVYRARGPLPARAIRSVGIRLRKDGSYGIRFTLKGVDLSRLLFQDPSCMPMAVIVGDDDGFVGVNLTIPSLGGRRVRITNECSIGDEWPWL